MAKRHSPVVTGAFLLLGAVLASRCSKATSPTSPGGSGGSGGSGASIAPTTTYYIGVLAVDGGEGLGGTVEVSAPGTARLASVSAIQPHEAATGKLTTDAGTVVPLTGTLENNAYNLTGGGYTLKATVDGLALTGTGTAPGGFTASLTGTSGTSFVPAIAYCGTYTEDDSPTYPTTPPPHSGPIKFTVDWGRPNRDPVTGHTTSSYYADGYKTGRLGTHYLKGGGNKQGQAQTVPTDVFLATSFGYPAPLFFRGTWTNGKWSGSYDSNTLLVYGYLGPRPGDSNYEAGTWTATACGGTTVPPEPATPPTGAFVGAYRILATETYRNSTGALDPVTKTPVPLTCTSQLALTGTITINTSGSGSSFTADVDDTFTETLLSTTCPSSRTNPGTVSGGAQDYKGSSNTISIRTSQGGGGNTRSHEFTGALNGNIITGIVTKTFSSSGSPPVGPGAPAGTVITATYGPSSATVILQKK